jgi:plastocyanin
VRSFPRILVAVSVVAVAFVGANPGPARAGRDWTVTASGRGANGTFSALPGPIDVGDTVTWQATEGDHEVASEGGAFESGPFAYDYEPHTYSYTFTKPGRYPYHCTLSSMTGVIEVRDPSGGPTTTEPPSTTTTRELYKASTTTTARVESAQP